eukprot:scaffold24667_cov58-Phaeocystis_antarctica.AAC.4
MVWTVRTFSLDAPPSNSPRRPTAFAQGCPGMRPAASSQVGFSCDCMAGSLPPKRSGDRKKGEGTCPPRSPCDADRLCSPSAPRPSRAAAR